MKLVQHFTALIMLLGASVSGEAQSEVENTKSFQSLMHRALDGNASAMNEVAVALSEGVGTVPNQHGAVVWFRRAAELGDAHGAGNLGLHYVRGQGLRRDKVLAAKWFMICHALDALRCHPGDFEAELKLRRPQYATAWKAAVLWLRARPDLENNHGDRPWFGQGGYPTVYRSK